MFLREAQARHLLLTWGVCGVLCEGGGVVWVSGEGGGEGRRGGEGRAGELGVEKVEDGGDGADEVELDDGAPRLALVLPCLARVRQLEVFAAKS